jgi:tetrahydromethanopterin S-methyltransferase subunit D
MKQYSTPLKCTHCKGKQNIGFILIAERAYIINHVVNPFIYGFHDSAFRKTCKELISDVLAMLRCARR